MVTFLGGIILTAAVEEDDNRHEPLYLRIGGPYIKVQTVFAPIEIA